MPILHHISANSHTCWSDAITFVGSMSSSEVTLTVCLNLRLLGFRLPKMGWCTDFRSQLVEIFSSNVISCCLMAFVAQLKWRQHHASGFLISLAAFGLDFGFF